MNFSEIVDNFDNLNIKEESSERCSIYNFNNVELEYLINENGALVIIYRRCLNSGDGKLLYDVGFDNCNIQHEIMMFGRNTLQPRFNSAFGESYVKTHKYSGAKLEVLEWLPEIRKLRDSIDEFLGFRADSCLINGYADGNH